MIQDALSLKLYLTAGAKGATVLERFNFEHVPRGSPETYYVIAKRLRLVIVVIDFLSWQR